MVDHGPPDESRVGLLGGGLGVVGAGAGWLGAGAGFWSLSVVAGPDGFGATPRTSWPLDGDSAVGSGLIAGVDVVGTLLVAVPAEVGVADRDEFSCIATSNPLTNTSTAVAAPAMASRCRLAGRVGPGLTGAEGGTEDSGVDGATAAGGGIAGSRTRGSS